MLCLILGMIWLKEFFFDFLIFIGLCGGLMLFVLLEIWEDDLYGISVDNVLLWMLNSLRFFCSVD